VGTVAIGLVVRVLAIAEESGLGFLGLENEWGESRVGLVGSIAKRLFVRVSAGAPGVGLSRFQFHFRGLFSGDIRFRHLGLLHDFSFKKAIFT
jgi:hypothetical protein